MHAKDAVQEPVTGEQLVSMFVMAMTNLVTAETAKYVASQTEQNTMRDIKAAAVQTAQTGQSQALSNYELLAKSSLQANVQKVQANEIDSFTKGQLHVMEADAKNRYRRKKIQVTVVEPSKKPVESISVDSRAGSQLRSPLTAKRVTGIFEDLSLLNNVLVLRPTLTARLILPNRKYLVAYIVDPGTLQPLVELKVL